MKLRISIVILLLASAVIAAEQPTRKHPDYVPNEKTAIRIAEAVLIGQYGEEKVNAQLLYADGSDKGYWKVEGVWRKHDIRGGTFSISINKYSGCIGRLIELK